MRTARGPLEPPAETTDQRRKFDRLHEKVGQPGGDRRRRSGTMVSPRASIATSVAIFFVRPAGVRMLLVRNASAKRFSRRRVRNVWRARAPARVFHRRGASTARPTAGEATVTVSRGDAVVYCADDLRCRGDTAPLAGASINRRSGDRVVAELTTSCC